jgi:hypothetical protein
LLELSIDPQQVSNVPHPFRGGVSACCCRQCAVDSTPKVGDHHVVRRVFASEDTTTDTVQPANQVRHQ